MMNSTQWFYFGTYALIALAKGLEFVDFETSVFILLALILVHVVKDS